MAWSIALLAAQLAFYGAFAWFYQPALQSAAQPEPVVITQDAISLFKSGQLPSFTETISGKHQAPLNFLVTAKDDAALLAALNQAGWQTADSVVPDTVWRLTKSVVLDQSYPTAPMTPSFWHTAVHNFGFEKETESSSARKRHHARFWRTNLVTPEGRVYVGTASFDAESKWLLVHKINPDIDTERELLFSDLQSAAVVAAWQLQPFVAPTLGKNFGGDVFFTDGKIYTLTLKKGKVAEKTTF